MPVWQPGTEIKCDGCGRVLVNIEGEVEHAFQVVHSRLKHQGTKYDDEGRKYELYDLPNACMGNSVCIDAIESSDEWDKRKLSGGGNADAPSN